MSIGGFLLVGLITWFIVLIIDYYFPDQEKIMLERLEGLKLYAASEQERKMNESLFARIYGMAESYVLRFFGDQISKGGSLAPLRIKLIQAGITDLDPLQHRAKRFIYCFGLMALALVTHDIRIIAIASIAGFVLPDYQLKGKREERQTKIKEEIPDFLDLLAATFPGSKGFEDAILRICERSKGLIPTEFQRVVEEINAGKRKRDALQAMALRCGVMEIDYLVAQIIQSDMLGTEMAETLRNQADKLRALKRQMAEIKARKASINLLLPSVFLLAAILVVVAGPSIVQFMTAMSSM